MTWSIVLDLVVCALLVPTIAYAIMLNRRLLTLRRQRAELESGTATFRQAVSSAEDGIARLKVTTEGLRQSIEAATALQNDLTFLVERAEGAADRLESGVRNTRSATGVRGKGPAGSPAGSNVRNLKGEQLDAPGAAANAGANRERKPKSETERALIHALGGGR